MGKGIGRDDVRRGGVGGGKDPGWTPEHSAIWRPGRGGLAKKTQKEWTVMYKKNQESCCPRPKWETHFKERRVAIRVEWPSVSKSIGTCGSGGCCRVHPARSGVDLHFDRHCVKVLTPPQSCQHSVLSKRLPISKVRNGPQGSFLPQFPYWERGWASFLMFGVYLPFFVVKFVSSWR